MKLRKNTAANAVLLLFALIAVSAAGVIRFRRSFTEWNAALYILSMLELALAFGGMLYPILARRGKKPLPKTLLGCGGFLAGAFGVIYLINNVLLHERAAALAAAIVTGLFAVLFTVTAFLCAAAVSKKAAVRVLAPILAAALLALPTAKAVRRVLPETYEHPYVSGITQTEGLSMAAEESKLIVNADDSHWWGFFDTLAKEGRFDDESMNAYVMQYADSGVTDVMFNIFCQTSDTPSDVMTFRGDLYGETLQNGAPVDYNCYYGLHEIYNVQHKDIFALWFDRCRAAGIRPWLSIRMNDCHDPDEETSPLRGDLFYTARENGWMIGDAYGYYRNCLNYALPEVREIMRAYIREQLTRYDVYGLELDFMREIYCFDYLNADPAQIAQIMNGFMREIKAIVTDAEALHGHEIRLTARLMRDIDQCAVFGFDVRQWQKEGILDAVTVTPRFTSNDSAMPIAKWKAALPGTEIWAGVETLVNGMREGASADAAVVRGYGAQYLTAGADGLYLFNYMSSGTVGEREREVYDTCGSLADILALPRRHVVTLQDTAPAGYAPYRPLPLSLKRGKPQTLEIETGFIPEGAKVEVFLGLNRAPADLGELTLTANGVSCIADGPCEVFGRSEADGSDVPGGYCETEGAVFYRFTLPAGTVLPNLISLEIANAGKPRTLVYAEIDVTP